MSVELDRKDLLLTPVETVDLNLADLAAVELDRHVVELDEVSSRAAPAIL
jgi:hypothetical protein